MRRRLALLKHFVQNEMKLSVVSRQLLEVRGVFAPLFGMKHEQEICVAHSISTLASQLKQSLH